MPEKKTSVDIEKILEGLKTHYQCRSLADLADTLGFTSNALYQWKKRGKLPVRKIIRQNPEIRKEYLKTGNDPIQASDETKEKQRLESYDKHAYKKLKLLKSLPDSLSPREKIDRIEKSLQEMRSVIQMNLTLLKDLKKDLKDK